MHEKVIKVGSRKSELALIQTRYVIDQLKHLYPEIKFEIHTMTTVGDRVLNISLPKIGEKSLFTKDLEDALKTGLVDLVVHSLKDLPTSLPQDMAIGAILEREDPSDALVLNEKFKGQLLNDLPDGSIIGTSSLRRSAQISSKYPHLKVCDVRGNLNTRLAKLDAADSVMAGLLLAKAGLIRMGWQNRIDQTLDSDTSLYAVGQGALAVECRANDLYITKLISPLSHKDTVLRVLAERSFLKRLGGGCSAPVAVYTYFHNPGKKSNDGTLEIKGAVWSLDGKTMIEETLTRTIQETATQSDNEEDFGSVAKRAKLNESCVDSEENTENIKSFISKLSNQSCFEGNESLQNTCIQKEKYESAMNKSHVFTLPVGQDFMGQCPFLEAGNIKNIEKCPFKIDKSLEASCPLRYSGENKEGSDVFASTSINLNNCPFFKKKEIISDDSKKNNIYKNVIECNQSFALYCGILEQSSIDKTIMEKCESLGKQLGDILIQNGALEIIQCAQMQINPSK